MAGVSIPRLTLGGWVWSLLALVSFVIVLWEAWVAIGGASGRLEQALERGHHLIYDIKAEKFIASKEEPVATEEEPVADPVPLEAVKHPQQAVPEAVPATEGGATQDVAPAAEPGAGGTPAAVPDAAAEPAEAEVAPQAVETVVPPRKWQTYAVPFNRDPARVPVSIIITGLGLSKSSTELALTLPKNVGLSFSPYSHDLRNWLVRARELGYEVFLDMPMEPPGYPLDDPGPQALMSDLTEPQIGARVRWLLSKGYQLVGLVSPADEKFTLFDKAVLHMATVLTKEPYLFVLGRTVAPAAFQQSAQEAGLDVLQNARMLDTTLAEEAIDAQLEQLRKGTSPQLAIGRPYPLTIKRVKIWSESLGSRASVEIVPPATLAATVLAH